MATEQQEREGVKGVTVEQTIGSGGKGEWGKSLVWNPFWNGITINTSPFRLMHDKLGLLVYKEEKQISPVGAVLIFPGGAVLISQGPSDIIGAMSAVHFALPKYYFCGFSLIIFEFMCIIMEFGFPHFAIISLQ